MSDTVQTADNQYLTFTLDGEQYAVEVGKVKEVLEFTDLTKVPRTHDFMRGVINLRGSVVPVVDLRLKFDMGKTEQTIDTSIVVMEVGIDSEVVVIGTLADSVQEVIGLNDQQIEPAPNIGTAIDNKFIRGIGKLEDRFIIILDIDRIFKDEELATVTEHTA
ncbi:MAG: chemotaxis protein CheW [Spirochaetaceae bacterium]|nr:MAG: chemotaxis protein CheW [Spirochaetaceae bacterium]